MNNYYFHNGTSQVGPLTIDELKAQNIQPDTPVWCEGMTEWTKAKDVDELKRIFLVPPPFPGITQVLPPTLTINNPQEQVESKRKVPFLPIGVALIAIIALVVVYTKSQQETALVQAQVVEMKQDQLNKENEKQRELEELTKKNRNYRNNWVNFFNARSNNYSYSRIGGIYDLQIIYKNVSEYMADEMVATVTYIKANGDVWKTIEVPCYNVPAQTEKTVSVPDVERGTSVQVALTSITSKKLHFYMSDTYNSGNPEDPYFSR